MFSLCHITYVKSLESLFSVIQIILWIFLFIILRNNSDFLMFVIRSTVAYVDTAHATLSRQFTSRWSLHQFISTLQPPWFSVNKILYFYMISTNACLVVGESIYFFFRIAKNVLAENTVTNVLTSLSSTTGESAVANQNVQTSQVHANEIFANVIWTLRERCLHNMKYLM